MAAEAGPGRLFVFTAHVGPHACANAAEALRLASANDEARVWIGTADDRQAWFHFKWDLVDFDQVFDVGGDMDLIDKVSAIK